MTKSKKHAPASDNPTEGFSEQAIAVDQSGHAVPTAEKKRVLTRAEVVVKLDQVMMLNIVASGEGREAQIVPGHDGSICWYSSVGDAREALGRAQAAMPQCDGFSLGLNFTPLGRALGLSEGWAGPKLGSAPPPMRLQASQEVKKAVEGALARSLPSDHKLLITKHNKRTGWFPLFFLEELQSKRVLPYFFSRDDLVRCWVASGRPLEAIPEQLEVTDLRLLVMRLLTEPGDWAGRLLFVPPQETIDLLQMVDGMAERIEQLGRISAEATGEVLAQVAAEHAAAIDSGEEPPALV